MLQGQALYGKHRAEADDGIVALGRNLFPILPEDAYDHGPQSRSHFRFVADVRLDNRPELVAGLGLTSADHTRLPDAALLFEALLKWGDDAVDRLVGEFAFAFWDGDKRELLLGRDFFGLRPLYFHQGRNFFAFASMPSGLHALSEVPYDFDPDFMVERLALIPQTGRQSYFRGIERVEPAHLVRVTQDGIQARKYWTPPAPDSSRSTPEDYEEGLRSVLDDAVRSHLRGAGKAVASQLSGGLDSSTVTATAARLMPDGKVVAFTAVPRAGFAGPSPRETMASEAELAAATARMYPNIEHVLIENPGESPLTWLDRNFLFQQQPMANLANAGWGQAIHKAAQSRGLNVILKASAGNLTVSYSGLEWLPLLLSRGQVGELAKQIIALSRNGVSMRSLASRTLGPFVPAPIWLALRRLAGRHGSLFSFSAVNRARADEVKRKSIERAHDLSNRPRRDPYENRLWGLTRGDGGNAYKGVLAEWGLSVRDPTADKRVIEFCFRIPFEEFVRGGLPRSLARRAFSDRLPPEVARSRLRGYQAADWYEAFDRARGNIELEVEAIARCSDAGDALDFKWLRETMSSWPSGRWQDEIVRARYRLGLLRGVSAGHFIRKVRGTN